MRTYGTVIAKGVMLYFLEIQIGARLHATEINTRVRLSLPVIKMGVRVFR